MTRRRRDPETTRNALLDATIMVLRERGAAHLTLDRVAEVAGVSKGGLLHHFRSKRALLAATVERAATDLDAHLDKPTEHPLRDHLAYRFGELDIAAELALLLQIGAVDPALLAPLRETYQRRTQALRRDTTIDRAEGELLRLAADGLWANFALGLAPPDPDLFEQTRALAMERVGTH